MAPVGGELLPSHVCQSAHMQTQALQNLRGSQSFIDYLVTSPAATLMWTYRNSRGAEGTWGSSGPGWAWGRGPQLSFGNTCTTQMP